MSNCNCRADIEAKLLARFKEQSPEASDHGVSLEGYAFLLGNAGMRTQAYMPFKQAAMFPLKKGGAKLQTKHINMMFSFCPFCGQPEGAAPADGAENIEQLAKALVARAKAFGVVLTIGQQALQPLAMGHYATVVAVRPQRSLEGVEGGAQ
ncbi:hypothetical protein [Rhodoferax sp. WC2427]|uniref:hypothetical protein n=1 Tax=Rhodoferax sp. WC2427 TaxID=3234144 RepID=UPI003466C41A